MFSLTNSALISSYFITIGCLILHRLQGRALPHSRFSLGKWGLWINIGAMIYITPICIFSFFPPTPNPTTMTMNWSCVMYGGIVILSTVYYVIWARKSFTPPTETLEDYIRAQSGYDVEEENGAELESVEPVKKDM
jgi:hypothetical protein